MRLALSKGLNRVGIFLPSPEDGNRFSFQNVVFSTCLEFRTMNKVHQPSDSGVIDHLQNPLNSSMENDSDRFRSGLVRRI
jgi:hypothetical protein